MSVCVCVYMHRTEYRFYENSDKKKKKKRVQKIHAYSK